MTIYQQFESTESIIKHSTIQPSAGKGKGKIFDNNNKYNSSNSSNNKVEKKLNEMTNEEFKEQLVGLVSYFLATTTQHLKM